ncbi:hypothetical protein [Streptomyces nigrescens]|uniref:hypothetical protein n=1 Tax=Streptomyces nigrescens TaxID=1920 RepID=UPI0021C42DC5|nr:hypothetical protein [Streptomyces nigrescens]
MRKTTLTLAAAAAALAGLAGAVPAAAADTGTRLPVAETADTVQGMGSAVAHRLGLDAGPPGPDRQAR